MSNQCKQMKVMIANARNGNEAAEKFLREFLKRAADSAPRHHLIELSECLLQCGIEAGREQLRQN